MPGLHIQSDFLVMITDFLLKYSWFTILCLVLDGQQSDSDIDIDISFFRFFSIIGCYKMLNIVPCAV